MDAQRLRRHAWQIFQAGLAAADADAAVARAVKVEGGSLIVGGRSYPLAEISRIRVVGMGKASAAMAGLEIEIVRTGRDDLKEVLEDAKRLFSDPG